MEKDLIKLAQKCKYASRKLASLDANSKNKLLTSMAESLDQFRTKIIEANETDLKAAEEKGLSGALVDRLRLNDDRIDSMIKAIKEIVQLDDPVGIIENIKTRPNGIRVGTMRIPLGVIAIIYEARPNVTSDAAALCIKSGNGVILRGGSEAFNSNVAIVEALKSGIEESGVSPDILTFIPTTDRNAMVDLLKLEEYIDLVIPRGGEGLIRFVTENSRIPVIKHYKGVCHLYVDKDADAELAIKLLIDGKTSRPAVCNALETLLVHKEIAPKFLPAAASALKKKNVEIRGCSGTIELIPDAKAAAEEDYYAEYLDLIIAVKIVSGYEEAVEHIAKYGSNHTDVIATGNIFTAQKFIRDVDSSSVMVNASSRFADGGELGLGAEIGISTSKLHAYGPMGLEALTTKKFIVFGEGQTRHKVEL
ncbi:glutamate-5-semialdehyde dehydrogenase [Melioribacter sp. Ez-97]|uniref:glutamate-5-semialdehyde dehydrogenase n=1 Tax=Melioribacter sp. Ez-97 TaxID=3423434 RepID=UPI003ED882F1